MILTALLLTGCVKSPLQKDPAGHLKAHIWSEVCPNSNPEVTWLRLRDDGIFDYSYSPLSSPEWEEGDDETWSLEKGVLTISWNNGYATTRYSVGSAKDGVIPGSSSKSCGDQITLEQQ